MKFKHPFQLATAEASYRIYKADHSTVRLDFFDHILRVAILRDGEDLFPTYTIRPRTAEDPATG